MVTARWPTFAEALRHYRQAAGLTQAALAEQAGLSMRAVSDIERGLKRPYKDTIARLADALQLAGPERARFEACARSRASVPTSVRGAPTSPPDRPHLAASGDLPPLVGRASELGLIARHLAPEAPSLLAVMGEPGIGKSRLLAEAAAMWHALGWSVLVGGCTRRSGQDPYAPFVDLLARAIALAPTHTQRRDLAGCSWLVRLLPELAETRAVPLPQWTLPAQHEQRLIFAAVARYLANVAGPAGTLLVLDDVQWAGQDALDLLASLIRPAATADASAQIHSAGAGPTIVAPLRVIAACRDTELRDGDPFAELLADLGRDALATSYPLAPLSLVDATELARVLLGESQGDTDAEDGAALAVELAERTGGHPFFLVSCAQGLRTDGAVTAGASGGPHEIPWNVATSIRQRVAGLPKAAQDVLGIAAVAGRRVPHATLLGAGAQTGTVEADLLSALDAADHARLLVEAGPDGYQFAHDLIREVVLADLGPARRATLHRRVAEALERLPEHKRRPEELAWHYREAGESARALPYVLAAGNQAEASRAHAEAERQYRIAAELAYEIGDARREAEALEKLADISVMLFRRADDLPMYERAAANYRAVGEREGELHAISQWIRFGGGEGSIEERLRRHQHLLSKLEAEGVPPSPALAKLYLGSGTLHGQAGLIAEQLVPIERAEQIARAVGGEMLGDVLRFRALVLSALGRGTEALCLMEQACEASARHGNAYGLRLSLTHAAVGYLGAGEIGRARARAAQALEVAERVGVPVHIAFQNGIGALVQWYAGAWSEAEQHNAAIELVAQAGTPDRRLAAVLLPLVHGLLDLARGGTTQATEQLEAAVAMARERDDRLEFALGHAALAEAALLAHDAASARARLSGVLAYLRAAAPLSERSPGPDASLLLLPGLAWAESECGDLGRASETVVGCVERARAGSWGLVLCDALRVRALIELRQDLLPDARRTLAECVSRCRAAAYPYAEAKALYVYGQLHAAMGETALAAEAYAQALAICERLGEGLYRPHIQRALDDTVGL